MKSQKSFRALLLVLFAALLLNGCCGGDSYETFSLAMDKMAGEGKWSDKGHSTSFFGGALTVEGVTVNLAEEGETVEIASIELKEPLAKEELQSILDAADWKDRQETTLAEALILKGVKRSAKQGEDVTVTSTLDELNLADLSLTAAASNAQNGLAGFMKAARVGKAVYSNFKGNSTGGESDMEMSMALMNVEGLAFDAEPIAGLDALDPSGLASVLSSFSAKSLSFKDMSIVVTQKGESPNKVTISLASQDQKDLKGFRAASSWALTGLKFAVEGNEDGNVSFGLESLVLNEADMTEYINKIMPLVIASASGEEDVEDVVNGMQTFADFFVSPFSLKDGAIKGFDFNVNNTLGFKMAEAQFSGPLTAGAIAPKAGSTVTGLEIILPESAEGLDEEMMKIYRFGQDFGMTRFVLDAASESSYDPATGRLTSTVSKFAFRDLLDIKLAMSLGGLTTERLNVLKTVTLGDSMIALMDPAGIFGEMSIENIDLTLGNLGLVERIYAYAGKTQLGGAPAENVKAMASGGAKMALAAKGGEYLASPEALGNSLAAFLNDPKNLQITLKAEPPLSVISAQAYAGDVNQMLNSLNLTVTANGETGVAPLRFNINQGGQTGNVTPEEGETESAE